jgi:hypothetical protein
MMLDVREELGESGLDVVCPGKSEADPDVAGIRQEMKLRPLGRLLGMSQISH